MTPLGHCLPPSSSLPPVRSLRTASEYQITSALHNLQNIYCPLRLPLSFRSIHGSNSVTASLFPPADSGYASQAEDDDIDDDDDPDTSNATAALCADVFERNFVTRWLTSLIARADELTIQSEETRARIIDDAALILSSFSDSPNKNVEEALTREFTFTMPGSLQSVCVQLDDVPLSGTDHTDVGLQSWGASIILSELMCTSPARFGIEQLKAASTIVELGAGTGLLSLTLTSLLSRLSVPNPTVVATDYHSAVLDNLRSNIAANFPSTSPAPVRTALLDWSSPSLEPPLDKPASMLVAADVVYAPEHAVWLRDCAAKMLALDGTFWLLVTLRTHGKFEGIGDTVEAAFAAGSQPVHGEKVLKIFETERLEKKRGIGRGDETGYMLYRIGWD